MNVRELIRRVSRLDDVELGPGSLEFAEAWSRQYAASDGEAERVEELRCAFVAGQLYERDAGRATS